MRFYLSVVFTILVMAADHTRDCEPLTETVRLPSVKVSKEIKETQISTVAEEPAPSAQIAFHKALIDGSTSRSDSHVPPYTFDDNPNLEWQLFNGSLPNGAVGIWNSYTNRYDYVCRAYDGCESGFYSSDFGKCLFPSYPLLLITQSFYILVNKDDFVFLEWKWGSGGSVPQNSIRTCFKPQFYVGKNKYGLGLLSSGDSFYLPWVEEYSNGTIYGYSTWYRSSYQALTVNTDKYKQEIKDVKYFTDQAKIIGTPPFGIVKNTLSNRECHPVTLTTTLSTSQTKTSNWQFSYSMTLSISTTVSASIPDIVDFSVTIGVEQTFTVTKEISLSQTQTTSLVVEVTVPPNMRCTIEMEGKKFTSNIPFQARLGRTYSNGDTKWTTITGIYDGLQVSDFQATAKTCEPVDELVSCGNDIYVSDLSSLHQQSPV